MSFVLDLAVAKALFHKNQRVYVKPVGTWARLERVVPQWTKGLDEPIRVFYDVGMGRDFGAEELSPEASTNLATGEGEEWRVMRARNKWQSDTETQEHPYPGTYPVVVTGEAEWGGWRVPGSEYALSPARIEQQARLIASAPHMIGILYSLCEGLKTADGRLPDDLLNASRLARQILGYIAEQPA